ncbi:MAG: potassium/proton antiporter [Tissierellia bacterium]|nr:potassium/proton antiporter [Tissierellia bacterium]
MYLLVIALVLVLALIAIRFSNKFGVPALLLFIVLGISFGLMGLDFSDYNLAADFSSMALMVIMFYGGFGTNWNMGKPVAKESIILSSLGVVTTALLTGVFCRFVLGFSLFEGMLLGSVVGSTDYASVSNILRSKNLNLKYSTAPLLELESGSNDPTAFTMTMIFLSLLKGSNLSVPLMIFKQVAFGIGVGFLCAWVVVKLINKIHFDEDGLFTVFIAAAIIFCYAITDVLGGNGYLALYILGIYLGNQQFHGKREMVFFFDGLKGIMQIGLFFLLGLLSDYSALLKNFPIALYIMIFMTIIARPVSVFGLMYPFKLHKNQLWTVSLAGLRGAAAIAFAIMVVNSGVPLSSDIFHIVFGICLLSSLIQGSLMAPASKAWRMVDPNDTVLKTFNDYQDKSDLGFIQTRIHDDSPWVGIQVKELNLRFPIIIAKIERRGKTIVPRGDTVINSGDIIVLGGETHFDSTGHNLTEFTIGKKHEWIDRSIVDLKMPEDQLIIMLQRTNCDIIVPDGNTVLKAGDKLVMLQSDHK